MSFHFDVFWIAKCTLEGIQVLVSPEAVRIRKVLASDEGKARYALRKSTVEPVFGQIKARCVHSFRVDEEKTRLLNFYFPGGFEKVITESGVPAKARVGGITPSGVTTMKADHLRRCVRTL